MHKEWTETGKGAASEFNAHWKSFNNTKKKVCELPFILSYLSVCMALSNTLRHLYVANALVRKLDLLHLCFSLNFYFFLCFFTIAFYVYFTNLFSIMLFLIC